MTPRYLRKADGTYVCRDDGQPVTNHGSHLAQWHSLSPRPNPDAMSGDTSPAMVTYSDYRPIDSHGWRGPIEAQ